MRITKVDDFALLILCMAFGGVNGLFHYPNIINEPVTDLANDLLNSDQNEKELFSLHIKKIAEPVLLYTSLPFSPALSLDIEVPFSLKGKADDFIGNIIIDSYFDQGWKCLTRAVLLALQIFG